MKIVDGVSSCYHNLPKRDIEITNSKTTVGKLTETKFMVFHSFNLSLLQIGVPILCLGEIGIDMTHMSVRISVICACTMTVH